MMIQMKTMKALSIEKIENLVETNIPTGYVS